MALITCPECGKAVSDKANSCPSCGAPITAMMGNFEVTREYSDYLQNYLFRVDIDDGLESFDIAMDQTFDFKLPFGEHNIAIYYHKSLVYSRKITMNENYYFAFAIGPQNNIIVLNNSGASKRKKIIDVGNPNTKRLICPNCHSQNIIVQMVTEQKLVKKKHSIIYWLCFGWLLSLIIWFVKWFIFTIPAIIFKLFGIGGKKRQISNEHKAMAVCQNCGYNWTIR